MIQIKQAVVVEGKYDKIKLESILDGVIIQTDGFRIFRDREKCAMLKALADTVGLLVITDSDVAGFKIRNYIRSITQNSPNVTNVYIPQIAGKERRKTVPSKEGTLGVEGLDADLLRQLLEQQRVPASLSPDPTQKITKADLYEDGFCGRDGSAGRRLNLLKRLNLPEYLSTNALLPVLNALITTDEYKALVKELSE